MYSNKKTVIGFELSAWELMFTLAPRTWTTYISKSSFCFVFFHSKNSSLFCPWLAQVRPPVSGRPSHCKLNLHCRITYVQVYNYVWKCSSINPGRLAHWPPPAARSRSPAVRGRESESGAHGLPSVPVRILVRSFLLLHQLLARWLDIRGACNPAPKLLECCAS